MDRTESTARKMLTAIEAPLYDIGVLSDRGMLPGIDSIPGAAVLDRLSLLKRSRMFPKLLGTFAAQTLAERYHADPSAGGLEEVWTAARLYQLG